MKKFVWIFLAMLLALIPVGSVFAQDAPPVLCGELDEEDCADLWKQRLSPTAKSPKAPTISTSTLKLAGIPGMPVEQIAFNWVQEAVYVFDPDLEEDMTAYLEGSGRRLNGRPQRSV